MLDFEKNGHYPGGSMRPDQAIAFIERIHERTGVYPGVYSGEYHLAQVLNSARVTPAQQKTLTNCWLWVANYSKEPRATAPWSYWALWHTPVTASADFHASTYPIEPPTCLRPSSTFSEEADLTWQTSGNGARGILQEGNLSRIRAASFRRVVNCSRLAVSRRSSRLTFSQCLAVS